MPNKMNIIAPDYDMVADLYCCMYSGCGNEYFSKYNLKRHVESVHLKLKSFKCSLCQKLFSSKQNLKEHYYKHEGISPFQCVTCNKFFNQASLLSLHKRAHKAEGTSLVTSKSNPVSPTFKYEKVEVNQAKSSICLPRVDENRQGVKRLPFPE